MNDTTTSEAPAEAALPILPPAPAVAAEVEAAPSEAAAPVSNAPTEKVDHAAPEGEAPAAAPELAFANGSTSELVVDHFIDSAESGDQSMNQIKAALPHVDPNTVESAVRRLWQQGRLLRVSPGVYRLAPEKPPEPAKPASHPQPPEEEQTWFEALERWAAAPSSWNVQELGPLPGTAGNRVPILIWMRFSERLRKRIERKEQRDAALARQAAADDVLRAKLVAGCFGNVTLGAGINDLAPIKAMLADGVPVEDILIGLKRRCDRRIDPRAPSLTSWREERFLTEVARTALLGGLLPRLVEAWSKAGIAPANAVDASKAASGTQEPAAP